VVDIATPYLPTSEALDDSLSESIYRKIIFDFLEVNFSFFLHEGQWMLKQPKWNPSITTLEHVRAF
jgi:hypothetical protein